MKGYENKERNFGGENQKDVREADWGELEKMADSGGGDGEKKVEWSDLAEVPMATSENEMTASENSTVDLDKLWERNQDFIKMQMEAPEEVDDKYERMYQNNQDFIRMQMEGQGEVDDGYEKSRNPKLELMREHWGDFEASRDLFAENTKMSGYEYGVIARHYSWDEFTKFADDVYKEGHEGKNYRDTIFDAAQVLQRDKEDFLTDWRPFDLAVKRYNTIKHFGEMPSDAKFYAKVSEHSAEYILRGQKTAGFYNLELGYDGDNETVAERIDPGGNLNATLVLNQEVMNSDEFDPLPKIPKIDNLEDLGNVEAILASNIFVQYKLVEENQKNDNKFFPSNKIIKTEDWEAGEREINWDKLKEEHLDLWDRTFRKIGRKQMRERINKDVERADKESLRGLVKRLKTDPDQGIQEAANYFGNLLGVGDIKIHYKDKKDRDLGGSRIDGISVSPRLRRRPKRMLATIAHEVWHQRQDKIARKWRDDELEKGSDEEQLGMLYYNNRSGYRDVVSKWDASEEFAYGIQLYEKEAEYFAKQMKKKVGGGRTLGR